MIDGTLIGSRRLEVPQIGHRPDPTTDPVIQQRQVASTIADSKPRETIVSRKLQAPRKARQFMCSIWNKHAR